VHTPAWAHTRPGQFVHQLDIRLNLLTDPGDHHVVASRGGIAQRDQPGVIVGGVEGQAQVVEPRYGVSVRAHQRLCEHRDDPAFHRLAHNVLPPACLDVHVFPVQADDVHEQPLGQAVLAHYANGLVAALVGQLEMPVAGYVEQAVALHARHRLADCRPALPEALGNPGAQGSHALFFELVHGPQVHLGRVDQIAVVAQVAVSLSSAVLSS